MIKDTRNNEMEHGNTEEKGKNEESGNGMNQEISAPDNDKDRIVKADGGDMPVKEEDRNNTGQGETVPDALKDELKQRSEEIEKKKEEIEALKDILKRRQADFENYKKRVVKSQDEYRKFAIKDMAVDIININDDMLRAIEAAVAVCSEKETSQNAFIEGITMISRRIEEMLQKFGVVEIECLNREFDPNLNEAVETEESDDVDKDTVTRVYQKGFRLDEYVVRTAKVKVTRKARGTAGKPGEERTAGPESSPEA